MAFMMSAKGPEDVKKTSVSQIRKDYNKLAIFCLDNNKNYSLIDIIDINKFKRSENNYKLKTFNFYQNHKISSNKKHKSNLILRILLRIIIFS